MPVVSRVSGADDLVQEGVSGLFFPPGDEAALADAARGVSRDDGGSAAAPPARRRGRRYAARFSLDQVVERHLTLYRKLIEAGP